MKKNVSIHRERDEVVLRITARYVAQVQQGQQPRLSDYLARYPHYADAIADFVAYYHAIEARFLSSASVPDLAMKLDLSTDIVMQLEQRLIDPESIPRELYRRLSHVLQLPLPAVLAHFLVEDQYFNSIDSIHSQKKIAEQQEKYLATGVVGMQRQQFRLLVTSSDQLSAEQKASWCKIVDQEGI